MAVALLAAMVLAVGPPEPGPASRFMFGDRPDLGGELATAVLILWLVVVVVAATATIVTLRNGRAVALIRNRSLRAVLIGCAGVVALAVGTLHHVSGNYSMCCGNSDHHVQEARGLVH